MEAELLKTLVEQWGPIGLALYLVFYFWKNTPKSERPAPPQCSNNELMQQVRQDVIRILTILEERKD